MHDASQDKLRAYKRNIAHSQIHQSTGENEKTMKQESEVFSKSAL